VDPAIKEEGAAAGLNIYFIGEVIAAGTTFTEAANYEEPKKETVYMFCYTSGTTGDPKAAKLTHANMLAAATSA